MTYGRNDLGIGLQPCDRLDVAENLARRWTGIDVSSRPSNWQHAPSATDW